MPEIKFGEGRCQRLAVSDCAENETLVSVENETACTVLAKTKMDRNWQIGRFGGRKQNSVVSNILTRDVVIAQSRFGSAK